MKRSLGLTLSAILIVIAGTNLNAQNLSIGFRGGLNIPNLTAGGNDTPLSEGYKSRLAGAGGIFAEYQFSKLFSIRVGVEYSGQGGQKNGIQALPSDVFFGGVVGNLPDTDPQKPMVESLVTNVIEPAMPQYLYYDVDSKAKFDYLMVPVLAKFGWDLGHNSPFRVYVSAGPFVSYLLSGKRVQSGTSGIYATSGEQPLSQYFASHTTISPQDPRYTPAMGILMQASAPGDKSNTQNITDDLYRFNFGFAGYAGVSYSFAQRHSIFFEGGGNYGFIKLQKNDKNGANRIGAGSIMLGYTYTFGK